MVRNGSRMIEFILFNMEICSTVWTLTTDKRQYLQPRRQSQTRAWRWVRVCVWERYARNWNRSNRVTGKCTYSVCSWKWLFPINRYASTRPCPVKFRSPIPKMDHVRFERSILTAHFRNLPFRFHSHMCCESKQSFAQIFSACEWRWMVWHFHTGRYCCSHYPCRRIELSYVRFVCTDCLSNKNWIFIRWQWRSEECGIQFDLNSFLFLVVSIGLCARWNLNGFDEDV